jgi:hypothetical protein
MSTGTCRFLAVSLVFLLTSSLALAQRPVAPVGYLVGYTSADGKLLPTGQMYRVTTVYTSEKAARDMCRYYDSKGLRSFKTELYTERAVQAAIRLTKDPKVGFPPKNGSGTAVGAGAPKVDAANREGQPERDKGKISDSRWRVNGTTFNFLPDGSVATSNGTSGNWWEEGGKLYWSLTDGPFQFRYSAVVTGNSIDVTYKSYNPRTGNESTGMRYGTGNRLSR